MRFGGQRNPCAKLQLPVHAEFVNRCMQNEADLSAKSLAEKIKAEFGITISVSRMNAYRQYLGWKQGTTRYCQMIRDVNRDKRKQWCELQITNAEQFNVSTAIINGTITFFVYRILCFLSSFKFLKNVKFYFAGCDFYRRVKNRNCPHQ